MDIALTYFVKELVLPPASLLVPALCAALARRRWPRAAGAVLLLSLGALTALSTPIVAGWLAEPLEGAAVPFTPARPTGAEAIVVLGRGRALQAPEYGRDTVTAFGLERLRYAANLQRLTGLPLAVTGGAPLDPGETEGDLMREVLEHELGVPVSWVERESRNTAENALGLRRLTPFNHVLLVTHALHMPRARAAFEAVGFEVTPAPLGFVTRPGHVLPRTVFDFVPGAAALAVSRAALHEYLGMLWYRLRAGGS